MARFDHSETGISGPLYCRSAPELNQLRAHLSALLPYRFAAGVLAHLPPAQSGMSSEALRGHTLNVGKLLREDTVVKPVAIAEAVAVTVDATFIRGCRDGGRHLEVRVGNAETSGGSRQVFGAVVRLSSSSKPTASDRPVAKFAYCHSITLQVSNVIGSLVPRNSEVSD